MIQENKRIDLRPFYNPDEMEQGPLVKEIIDYNKVITNTLKEIDELMIEYDIHHTDRADGYIALKKAEQIIKNNMEKQ